MKTIKANLKWDDDGTVSLTKTEIDFKKISQTMEKSINRLIIDAMRVPYKTITIDSLSSFSFAPRQQGKTYNYSIDPGHGGKTTRSIRLGGHWVDFPHPICDVCNKGVDKLIFYESPEKNNTILVAHCHGETERVEIPHEILENGGELVIERAFVKKKELTE